MALYVYVEYQKINILRHFSITIMSNVKCSYVIIEFNLAIRMI